MRTKVAFSAAQVNMDCQAENTSQPAALLNFDRPGEYIRRPPVEAAAGRIFFVRRGAWSGSGRWPGNGDDSVPGHRRFSGVVGVGHDGDGAGLGRGLTKGPPVVVVDIALFPPPLADMFRAAFHRDHNVIGGIGVGHHRSSGEFVGPDVIDGSGFPEQQRGKNHIDPGGVIVPGLGAGIALADGVGHPPFPAQQRVFLGVVFDFVEEARGGATAFGSDGTAAILLGDGIAGGAAEIFFLPVRREVRHIAVNDPFGAVAAGIALVQRKREEEAGEQG